MTQAQHTPGPWHVADKPMTSSGLAIFCSDPNWPTAIAVAKPAPAFDAKGANFDGQSGEANAALIAAAPAMLAALRALANALRDNRTLTRADCSVLEGEARAAIAAATGTPTGEGGHPIPAAQQGEG